MTRGRVYRAGNEGAMPASNALVRVVLPGVIGALVGAGAVEYRHRADVAASPASMKEAAADVNGAKSDFDGVRADVARLKANALVRVVLPGVIGALVGAGRTTRTS